MSRVDVIVRYIANDKNDAYEKSFRIMGADRQQYNNVVDAVRQAVEVCR